jgi:hypothetical protein
VVSLNEVEHPWEAVSVLSDWEHTSFHALTLAGFHLAKNRSDKYDQIVSFSIGDPLRRSTHIVNFGPPLFPLF